MAKSSSKKSVGPAGAGTKSPASTPEASGKAEDKRPVGRPTDYNAEIVEAICEWIAAGKSLRSFTSQPNTPDLSTITRWIVRHDEFRTHYVQARESAGFAHADGIIEIAELLRSGEVDPQTGKAIVDALKWAAERMAPKHHSPRQEVTGAEGGPIKTESRTWREMLRSE